jgi:hypothetical protein
MAGKRVVRGHLAYYAVPGGASGRVQRLASRRRRRDEKFGTGWVQEAGHGRVSVRFAAAADQAWPAPSPKPIPNSAEEIPRTA